MKILSTILAASAAFALTASAQQATTQGVLMLEDGSVRNAFIVGATRANVFYLEKQGDAKPKSVRKSQLASLYLMEPKDYSQAMALFEDRKYSEAYKRFSEVKKKYKKTEFLDDNYHKLASFYQLECLRKQMDLAELVKAVVDFGSSSELTRENQQTQLEAYPFWEAVHSEKWGRVIRMANDWRKKSLPVSIRAQVAYCEGLALENENKPEEALNAYAVAMTADYTQSEVIVRNAVLNSLRIYQTLIKAGDDTAKYEAEAKALAALYEKTGLGAGAKLPAEYQSLVK